MARNSVIKSFYASPAWGRLRLALIAERGPVCQKCGETVSEPRDLIAHHTKELTSENVNDASISLNPENIELICFSCHSKEHHRFGYENEHAVYLVYGPPLSGKKTFARQSMNRGDLIVDLDRLSEAVSMQPSYDKPDNLKSCVFAVQDTLIDIIKTRYGKWHDAYIIGGYPDKYRREHLADELGAELVFCNVTRDECHKRLAEDKDRYLYRDQWARYVDEWFEKYTA